MASIAESVFFESVGGKRVFCCLTEQTGQAVSTDNRSASEASPEQKKLVIMSHGFTGSSLGPGRIFVDLARSLAGEGISALRFDQPHSGNSEGDYIDSSFAEWVETIVCLGKKYLGLGYRLALMGQSMGATASVIAAGQPELEGRVACLILWVPDPKTIFTGEAETIYEEGGQKYRGRFWTEASRYDFFDCLESYQGGIHLVYGAHDRFVSSDLRERAIRVVREKGQDVTVLEGQGHSSWPYDVAHEVSRGNIAKLKQHLG